MAPRFGSPVLALAFCLVWLGCGEKPAARRAPRPVETQRSERVSSAPTTPETTPLPPSPTNVDWKLPADGGKGTFRDLEVSVVEVVEKRLLDGSGMMRVTLRLKSPGHEETVALTSDEPNLEWNGYRLEYKGGWRDEVELSVRVTEH